MEIPFNSQSNEMLTQEPRKSLRRDKSLNDIDKDIEQIWRQIKDFENVGSNSDLAEMSKRHKVSKLSLNITIPYSTN